MTREYNFRSYIVTGVHSSEKPSLRDGTARGHYGAWPSSFLPQTVLRHVSRPQPQTALTSPRMVLTSPQTALRSPRMVLTSPQTALRSPATVLMSPQTVLKSPWMVLTSPATVLMSPATVLSSATVLTSPETVSTSPATGLKSPAMALTSRAAVPVAVSVGATPLGRGGAAGVALVQAGHPVAAAACGLCRPAVGAATAAPATGAGALAATVHPHPRVVGGGDWAPAAGRLLASQ